MPAGLAPPPLEQGVVAYLRSRADGIHVGTRVPRPRPPRFVVAELTGGEQTNLVQARPTVLIQVWGSGTAEEVTASPWPLARDVWGWLAETDEVGLPGVDLMDVDLTYPVSFPDEATGTPRYTFVYFPTVNLN